MKISFAAPSTPQFIAMKTASIGGLLGIRSHLNTSG